MPTSRKCLTGGGHSLSPPLLLPLLSLLSSLTLFPLLRSLHTHLSLDSSLGRLFLAKRNLRFLTPCLV